MTMQEISCFPHCNSKLKAITAAAEASPKAASAVSVLKTFFFFFYPVTEMQLQFSAEPSLWLICCFLSLSIKKHLGLSTPQDLVFETLKLKVKYITASGKAVCAKVKCVAFFDRGKSLFSYCIPHAGCNY